MREFKNAAHQYYASAAVCFGARPTLNIASAPSIRDEVLQGGHPVAICIFRFLWREGRVIVGIDLGTTNSAVGVWRDGRAELIPNSLGDRLTPSVVGLDDDGSILVGLAARERQVSHPSLTIGAFKRLMGAPRQTRLARQSFRPEELSALVIRALKADVEAHLGGTVTEAVISVPAYFNDKQRKATRRAGELAGLKVERLVNEPTAAALAYGLHELENESRFLVFDLGGGTFDVSIVEIFEGVIEVRASTGDNHLGGEDFNTVIVNDIVAKLPALHSDEALKDPQLQQVLRLTAERVRRALTGQEVGRAEIVWRESTFEYELAADEFEILSRDLLQRLREPVVRAIRDGGLRIENLDEIILVGGATRMPIVRREVTRMCGRFPASRVHPDEAVAIGATVLAGLKARDAALKEVVLTDVCPYSLGVDVGERTANGTIRTGLFSPIIERNTVIPASRVATYSTMADGQEKVRFNIFQGESRQVSDNIPLGRVEIPVPPAPAGQVSVNCRFSYDINGLIEVDVDVPQTGEHRQLVIVDDESMTTAELNTRRALLATLKVHPRELDANRAALARAARCFEMSLGEGRARVAEMISRFENALDGQDPRRIEHARREFCEALDAIEGAPYL